ncbi:hypothetical protein BO83DRAFT_442463 [Aspergillus eucalypticola CBS 122712]|uniref:Purine and uridine phosphorylase n=1 Tax=Aspergillus eucalypticola (strain CBS 122712 / IBT 29274) TaxID=1448314 RepID=A0A317UKE3_ASPEC|nr:uncharacterized protein BO83DRAFT_442463 [Aspergillus eucalypticola CBS 122712]PWY61598.1 hypothetical protein BO83DRAFT_442463 [Aspergillus eucalypticola CBS 122712]
MSEKNLLSYDEFAVGWICALPLEMAAAKAVLDEEYPNPHSSKHHHSIYVLGKISGHKVVITCLPYGIIGTTAATAVVDQMLSTFRSIRFGLMVGIGGGVPSAADVRLGDVVVSKPTAGLPGVIQYDYGKTVASGRFEQTGTLNKPPLLLLSALSSLEADHLAGGRIHDTYEKIIANSLRAVKDPSVFGYPGVDHDWLFDASYDHDPRFASCAQCDPERRVRRKPRGSRTPVVHYGNIASGNQVMKHGLTRDHIAQTTPGILCFEMEAAGIMDYLSCLVIRGICDYSDSHKNKDWQGWAALSAAVYSKMLLARIPPHRGEASTPIKAAGPGTSIDSFDVRFDTIEMPQVAISVGRAAELEMILKSLHSEQFRGIVSLSGMGGIGKTQIAMMYLMRQREKYSSVFWIDASSFDKLYSSYSQAARRILLDHPADVSLNKAMKKGDRVNLAVAVNEWLSRPSNNRWLLIYDGFDLLLSLGPDRAKAINRILPPSKQGHIILTTRDYDIGIGHQIQIRKLTSIDDSLNILTRVCGRPNLRDDPYTISLLAQLDGLPLAIMSAGSYLKQSVISCGEYLNLYKDCWLQLQQLAPQPQPSSPEEKSLHTTWKVTLNQIMLQHKHAALLLKQWIAYDSNDVWHGLFYHSSRSKSMSDLLLFDTAMAVLSRYGWVEPEPEPAGNSQEDRGYSLQKCIHAWLQYEDSFVPDMNLITRLAVGKICMYQWNMVTVTNSKFFSRKLPARNRLLPHADRCLEIYLSGGKDEHNRLSDLKGQMLLAGLYMTWSIRISTFYTFYLDFLCLPYEEKQYLTKTEDLCCLIMDKLDMQHDIPNREVQEMMSELYLNRGAIRVRHQQFLMAAKMLLLSLRNSNSECTTSDTRVTENVVSIQQRQSNAQAAHILYIKLTGLLDQPILLISIWALILYIVSRHGSSLKDSLLDVLLLLVKPMAFLHLLRSRWMQRWKTLVLWLTGHACCQVYFSVIQSTRNWAAFTCGTYGEVAFALIMMPMFFREGIC